MQLYSAPEELDAAVAAFLTEGFAAGEPALVVAAAERIARFDAALRDRGWDPDVLGQSGRLTMRDADSMLESIMDAAGLPSRERFSAVVGDALDEIEARGPGPVRVFGEMVDILCGRGLPEAAAALEDLWNELGLRRDFSLLCGYCVDVFDQPTQAGLLPQVCSAHTHVEAAADGARLHRAVGTALVGELGPTLASRIHRVVDRECRDGRVPLAQQTLMWVSVNLPGTARRVLATARAEYDA